MKTPERSHSGVFIVNYEQILQLFLLFILMTLKGYMFAEMMLASNNFSSLVTRRQHLSRSRAFLLSLKKNKEAVP